MRIVSIILFFALSLFAKEDMVSSILQNVLVKNAQNCLKVSEQMQKDLDKKNPNIKQIREDFGSFVYEWKKVQATYVAGDLNEDFIDTPRMIDVYHQGNEDITKQLSRIRKSKNSLENELYKNSHKSINALEYILFSEKNLSNKDIQIAKLITKNISNRVKNILNVYKNDTKKFLSDETFANGIILNALIDSSYKAKQWRLGEALAKEKKFKTKDKSRLEYVLSSQSLNSLKGIVDAFNEVLNAPYSDFGDMALKNGAKKDVIEARELLNELTKLLKEMKESDLMGEKGEKAYELLNKLYINYALYMVGSLEITAKIIEADGD